MRDDEVKSILEQLPADEPPADFAERVVAARRAEREQAVARLLDGSGPPRRRRPWLLAAVTVGVLAAGVGLFWATSHKPSSQGFAGGLDSPDQRRTLAIGGRAVAVAEAGAGLSWKLAADGSAHVQQARGSVFYRVDHGGPFIVETPAGEVRVLGTCFRVEVDPMHPLLKNVVAAGAGAVVASAVVVTVYEGKVRVASPSGSLDVKAGEVAALRAGEAPTALDPLARVAVDTPPLVLGAPPADITREQLLVRDSQQREQIATLDGKVRALEAERAALAAKREGGGGRENDKVSGFSPEEWAQMAEKCEVSFDLPQFGNQPPKIPPARAAAFGWTDDQRRSAESVLARFNEQYMDTVRGLYVEVTGDTAGAESLEPFAMVGEIEHKSPPGSSSAARKRVALEKAGKAQPPADPAAGLPIERLFRYLVNVSDQAEAELASVVGAEKAALLREKGFGHRSRMSGCGGDEE